MSSFPIIVLCKNTAVSFSSSFFQIGLYSFCCVYLHSIFHSMYEVWSMYLAVFECSVEQRYVDNRYQSKSEILWYTVSPPFCIFLAASIILSIVAWNVRRSEAGKEFQIRGLAAANDLSPTASWSCSEMSAASECHDVIAEQLALAVIG